MLELNLNENRVMKRQSGEKLRLRRIEEPPETTLQCPHPVHPRTLMQLRAALVHRLDCTILPRLVEMASYRNKAH